MAKLRPLGDKILVKRVEAESKTKSGIVLPDSAKEKPKRGKIVAVGDGKRLENGEKAPFTVKKGDEVIFTSYAGTEIKLDGEELMIMSEDDVLAVVEKHDGNPKSEYRNPKQIRMGKIRISNFDIVSDFHIRISNLID
jgi:chaperonin GroES